MRSARRAIGGRPRRGVPACTGDTRTPKFICSRPEQRAARRQGAPGGAAAQSSAGVHGQPGGAGKGRPDVLRA